MKITTFTGKSGKEYSTVEITRCDTRGRVFSVQDNFSIVKTPGEPPSFFTKLKFMVTVYGQGQQNISKSHYVDIEPFMFFIYEMLNGKEPTYTEYKGTKSTNYSTGYESRMLQIEPLVKDPTKRAYVINLTSSAGKVGENGQVMPAGGPQYQAKIIIPEKRFKEAMLAVYNYVICKQTFLLTKLG